MNGIITRLKRLLTQVIILSLVILPWPVTTVSAQVVGPGPNVNVSMRAGNQTEVTVAINPANAQQVFIASNDETLRPGLFMAQSLTGGTTWTRGTLATGAAGDGLPGACCDPSASWDQFGNLFVTYLNQGGTQIELLISTNGGTTFTSIGPLATGFVDQPTVTTGAGAVWVTYLDNLGTLSARGAQVTGLGVVGAFNAAQAAPGSAGGNFGDIAIGPAGQVMVTYQQPSTGQGPATILINLDADGLGAGGFGASINATTTNVGGFDFIPAQPDRSVDAEADLIYDRSGGPRNGRVYLVYTDEAPDESHDMDIFLRFSDGDGAAGTWSAPVQVNDDTTVNSQFLPRIALDQATGDIAVSWHDARADGGTGPADADGPNNDAQFWGTWSINGGASFLPNVLISAGTSDEDGAEPPAPFRADIDYGDYTGADLSGGNFYVAWADNSNSTGDNPDGTLTRFDIYVSRVVLIEQADLSITKSDSPDPVLAGNNLTYTLTVTNNGPNDATGVAASDSLPAGVNFVSATPSQGSCSEAGGIVSCNLGDLANAASATITITVTIPSSTLCGTTLANTAAVTSADIDPNLSNNTASADTLVNCQTDLFIAKSASPDPVYTGTLLTYELSIFNAGPSDATGVTVIDNLPVETAFSSVVSSQGTCTEAGGIVSCDLGNLAAGANATVTIVVTPIAGGTVINTATVTGNEADPNLANNAASVTTVVILVVGLDIRPGNPNNPINPGSNGQFVVAVLSSDGFNAPHDVDTESLTFGRTGNEASLVSCQRNARDVDHDGLEDLVCHFYTDLTDLQPGDIEAILKGHTTLGILIEGRDSLITVPQ